PEDRGEEKIRAYLRELDLPWPSSTEATRPQLLDILVRASLQFGMPVVWAFYVGRHPSRPSENTIYMTLEPRCIEWIRDIEALLARGKADDYLRRCAEIVGGLGQSYSTMIRDVLDTHFDIADLVRAFWSDTAVPQFHNLNDPDLRRAVNGYLPDESQLWPADEIVNLQPELFARLNATLLSKEGLRKGFKVFLGAHIVWMLSPMLSRYLTSAMLADMGLGSSEENHRILKCIQALEAMTPMVKWQMNLGAQEDTTITWNIMRLILRSISAWARVYGEATENQVLGAMAGVVINAFNMTSTWDMIDKAFIYLPNKTDSSFFNAYRRAAEVTVAFFKQSLRQPEHSIYHVPGICMVRLYRLLVGRELILENYLTSSPLYKPWYPKSVPAAIAGTRLAEQIYEILWFTFYYNDRYQAAICNMALPASVHFRRAFKCGPQNRLFTNFTWPDFLASSTTTAAP
ncbi:hypothetical protein V5799_027768, partial [Amblyomma americanum]